MSLKLSGMASGMDTESMVTELMKAQNLKKTKIANKITTAEWKQDKWKTLNTKIYSFYTDTLASMKLQGTFNTKSATSSNESKATVTASTSAPEGVHSLKIKQLASAQFATGAQLGTDVNSKAISSSTKLVDLQMTAGTGNIIKVNAGGTEKSLEIKATTTVGDVVNTLKSAGLNASYDTNQKRFFVSSKESGYAKAFTLSTEGTVDLSKLGLSTITKTTNVTDGSVTVATAGSMKLVQPADAQYTYNGVDMTNASNNVSINGLSLTLKGVTAGLNTPSDTTDDEVLNIGVENNTQAVYDTIKNFVTKYNALLKEMNETYNAATAKGYDPLTDEQKESMTDDQIEKWENKIKDSLLRRDNTMSSLINSMRSNLSAGVKIDGKDYSLSSFGIKSSNYTELGTLHIDGNKDDSLVVGNPDKLLKALNENPDKVMTVINELTDKLYTSLTNNMKSTTLRSALTLYNDKEMTKQITSYKGDLSDLEDKLADIESRYYKQFSAMETAMSKMNSESSSLASMLGMSN